MSEQAAPGYYRVRLDQALDRRRADRLHPRGDAALHLRALAVGEGDRGREPPRAPASPSGSFQVTGPDEVTGSAQGRYPVTSSLASAGRSRRAELRGRGTRRRRLGRLRHDRRPHRDRARRHLLRGRRGRAAQPRRRGARLRLRRHARRARERVEPRARRGSRSTAASDLDRRSVLHRALPLAAAPERRSPTSTGATSASTARPTSPRAACSTRTSPPGTLQVPEPAARADPARRYREMLLSLLADHREGGKLPRWGEQNDRRGAHVRRPGDPDDRRRRLPRAARRAPRPRRCTTPRVALRARRPPDLERLGLPPRQRPGTTLEYGVADFALALLADALGRDADARRWLAASLRYRNLLDPETRFDPPAQRRRRAGARRSIPSTSTGFQEGNSWQYSWLAPHDARGLFDRMGGDGAAAGRLDNLFRYPPEALSRLNVVRPRLRDRHLRARQRARPAGAVDVRVRAAAVAGRWTSCATCSRCSARRPRGCRATTTSAGCRPGTCGRRSASARLRRARRSTCWARRSSSGPSLRVPGRPAFTVSAPGASLTGRYVRGRGCAGGRWSGRGSSTRWPRAGRWSCRWFPSRTRPSEPGRARGRPRRATRSWRSSAAGRGSVLPATRARRAARGCGCR